MRNLMRTWGIAVIAIISCIGGIVGNLIIDPSTPFILGVLTGAVLIVLINFIYVRLFKAEPSDIDKDVLK